MNLAVASSTSSTSSTKLQETFAGANNALVIIYLKGIFKLLSYFIWPGTQFRTICTIILTIYLLSLIFLMTRSILAWREVILTCFLFVFLMIWPFVKGINSYYVDLIYFVLFHCKEIIALSSGLILSVTVRDVHEF